MNQSTFVTVRTRFGFDGGEEDAAAFYQRRVANLGLFNVVLFGGFALLRLVIHLVEGDYATEIREPGFLFHIAALVPAGLLWLLCRGGKRNPRLVSVAEIVLLAATACCAIAMGAFWLYFPDEFVQLQRSSSAVREWIVARSWSARSESVVRFLLEDRQLLLISFILAARFLLGLVVLPFKAMFERGW